MGIYWVWYDMGCVLFGCAMCVCVCVFFMKSIQKDARKTNAPLTLWLGTVIWPLNSTTGVSDGFGLTGAKMTIIRFKKIEIGRNFLLSARLAAVKMNQWLGESFISSITPVVGCPSIEWRYINKIISVVNLLKRLKQSADLFFLELSAHHFAFSFMLIDGLAFVVVSQQNILQSIFASHMELLLLLS